MYTLKVKNNRGDILNLTNNPDYSVTRITGLNPPPATINKTANTTIDGSKINSTKIESRNIVIYIKPEGDIETSRIRLYKYFPSQETVTLFFKNGARNVYITGTVETVEINHCENPQIAQISIFCSEPYFKDIEILEISFSDITPHFEFPFSIPEEGIEISTYLLNTRKCIENPSDIKTGVTIKLYAMGEVINPTLYDVTHNLFIKLNISMQTNDIITITTDVDNKNVLLIRNGKVINALGYMRPDSKWFYLSAGDNVYTYECESGATNLKIDVSAPILYSGV